MRNSGDLASSLQLKSLSVGPGKFRELRGVQKLIAEEEASRMIELRAFPDEARIAEEPDPLAFENFDLGWV